MGRTVILPQHFYNAKHMLNAEPQILNNITEHTYYHHTLFPSEALLRHYTKMLLFPNVLFTLFVTQPTHKNRLLLGKTQTFLGSTKKP